MADDWNDIVTQVGAETGNTAVNNLAMQRRNPMLVARAKRLADRFGVGSPLVESDPDIFEEQSNREKAGDLLDNYPVMTTFFHDNPDTAAMVTSDDYSKLGNISGALGMHKSLQAPDLQHLFLTPSSVPLPKPIKAAPPRRPFTPSEYVTKGLYTAGGVALNAVTQTAQAIMSGAELATDVTGFSDQTDAFFRQQDKIAQDTLKNSTPEWVQPGWQTDVFSGLSSTVQMLLPLPLGKAAILPALAGTTGLQAYGKYQRRGASVPMSLLGGGLEGGIEWATEVLPTHILTHSILGREGKESLGKAFAKYFGEEIVGEQLATLGQDAVDTAIANPDTTWKQYWEQRPQAAWSTLIATVTTGATMLGAGHLVRRFGKVVDDGRDAMAGIQGQAILDEIMKNAADTPLRKTSPEEFARVIDHTATESPIKHVYLPIEAVDKVLADDTIPDEEKAALTVYQSQIDEARVTNGEVVIPIGEAAANLSGTKAWEALREDARVLAGGISGREAKEHMENIINELEGVGQQTFDEVREAQPGIEAKKAVYDEVKAQVVKAGRTEREAQTTAALFAARAETLASARYGMFKDAKEAWDWMKVQIRGPENAKAKGGRKVAQSAFRDLPNLLSRNDWAILTAADPGASPLPPEQNAIRNKELTDVLDKMGLKYTPVRGKYGTEQPSFAVEGIAQEQAQDLGKRFGQESVLTHRGLIYSEDNTVNPATGVKVFQHDPEDFFTELPTGEKFSVDINFDERVPLEPAQRFNQSDLTQLEQVASAPGAMEVAKSRQFPNMRDFKLALQDAVKATKVGNLREAGRLTRLALADARLALQNNANAIGWYGEKMEQAMSVLGELHPEINTDPDARFAFIYALSVTSQGLKVERNFKLADMVYREYRKTGRMPAMGEGTSKRIMERSLDLFNQFTEQFGGLGPLREFMLEEHTVGEVEKAFGLAVSGEHKGTKVKGAAILGPKIGNGYFSNLYGDFSQLTMDRWFIRTWGRWTGTLVNVDSAAVKKHSDRVKAILRDITPAQRKQLESMLSGKKTPYKIRLGDVEGFAKKIVVATASADVRNQLQDIHPQLRLSAQALAKAADGQKEAPQGPAERNEIRSIMGPVLAELQRDNPELTMADLQAVLWYPEKTLYDTSKAKAGAEAKVGYENEEAPDYANAAVALARSEGVDEEKINAAITRARGRVSASRRAGRAGRGVTGRPTAVRIAEDENGFPLEEGLVSQDNGQQDPTVYAQFGGSIGAINDIRTMSALERAMDLQEEMTPEQVWHLTGWMVGADGKWRFEIDDSKAELQSLPSPEPLRHSEATPGIDYSYGDPRQGASDTDGDLFIVGERLSKVLNHPKLFKFYPQLAGIPVFIRHMEPRHRGYFDGYQIVLNSSSTPEDMLSTLLHEIQHAVQTIEGFAHGAEPVVNSLYQIGLGPNFEAELEHFRAIARGDVPGMRFRQEMSDEQLQASAAFAIYERVAGEVEARNTQYRMQLTGPERRTTFPELTTDFDREHVLLPQPVEEQMVASQSTTGPTLPPRGETAFYPDGRTIVQLFKADFSTMLHEMSHVFLEQEYQLAQMPGASDELKADIAKLDKWFSDHNANFTGTEEEKLAAHELFARTGERYFREGKAPSAELRSTFKQLREWMIGVYKNVKDLLAYGPAPINPEVREIFDRMIATDEAIQYNSTQPMSQEELGMTTAEYDAYLDSVNNSRDAAYDTLLEKMMAAIRRREDKKMREQRANVRDDIAQVVNSDPRFIALHLLRTGRWLNDPSREATPVKINTGWLIDNYGEEILKALPVGLQPLHRGDGLNGDAIADLVGIPSGDALVKALVDLKSQADQLKAEGNPRPLRDQIIESRTDEAMAQRHGDLMTDGQIQEEAIAAINSNRQGEVLATELRQLKKKSDKTGVVTPYQILREWARRKANDGTVSDAVSKETLNRYIRLYNKARNAFEAAILKGDSDEAIKQKQAQMINHALLAESKKVADEVDAIVKRLQRYSQTKAMASIDQDYMDRIHELLEGYSFRVVSGVARQAKTSFEAWAQGQRDQGNEVYVPPRFRDDRTNWKDAKVSKILELNDMVQSLASLGRLKQKMIVAGEERRLEEMRDLAEASILALPERDLGEASTGETSKPLRQALREAKTFADYRRAVLTIFSPGSKVRQYASGLVKIEGLADLLDQTKMGLGVFNSTLIRGATDAANTYSTIKEEVMDEIAKAYRAMSGKLAARLNDLVTIPELTLNAGLHETDPRRGQPLNITRRQLVALVANTGNLSNLSKLVGGERWGEPESMVDMTRVQQTLIGYLNKEEMDFVQSLWDGMGKLWPHIVRVERQMTGIVPEAVTPMDVSTPWGTYKGGYWPVVWDSARTDMGKPDESTAEDNMFGVGTGLGTYKGHTVTRTGAMAPMDWSLERVLFARTNQIISRIAYAPWIRDSLKLLNAPRVSGAIRLRMGNEYLGAIKNWMRDQIPSNMQDIAGAKAWEKVLTAMRINMTATVLGVSYSTGVAQVQGLTYSAGVLGDGNVLAGPKWVAVGFQKMLQLMKSDGPGAQEFVFSRSEEMRRRAHELNREVIDVFHRLDRGGGSALQRAQRWIQARAFWHIAFIDLNTVSIPTWLGGYEKAKAQGQSEEDAAAYADKVVRLSQGSGREKDMSAIQRGNAGQRFISMFYTPSSVFFNQQWQAAQDLKAGNWSAALAPTFWFLIANTLMDALRNGDWPPEDEDGNVTPESIADWVGRNIFFGMFYGVPIARDIANTANRKLRGQYADWGSTPLSYGLQAIGKGVSATAKAVRGEKDLEGYDIKNMATAMGFVLGLPGNQVGKTTGFIKDVRDGKAHPEGAVDWFTGLTSGSVPSNSGSKQ